MLFFHLLSVLEVADALFSSRLRLMAAMIMWRLCTLESENTKLLI